MAPAKFPAERAERLHDTRLRPGLDPRSVVGAVGLSPGETVLDLGAGTGFFTLALAAAVGPTGRVIAADVSPEMLEALRQRAASEGWENLRFVPSEEQFIPLADAAVDRAFLVDSLHEAENPAELLRETNRVVRPGGEVVVIDWETGEGPPGPPAGERLGSRRTIDLLRLAGLPATMPLGEVSRPHFGLRAPKPADKAGEGGLP